MQTALVKMLLGLLSKAGLKILINQVAKSDMFQDFVKGLILSRIGGLKDKYPETYTSIEQYATGVAQLPAIFSDDDPANLEQVALAFRLKAVEANIEDVQERTLKVLVATKKARIKV